MNCKSVCAAAVTAAVLSGCNCGSAVKAEAAAPTRPVVYAAYTSEPIALNGKLDESAWSQAPVYTLKRPLEWKTYYKDLSPEELAKYGDEVLENGTLRMLYDDQNLYLGFELTDHAVKADGVRDQQAHFVLGDLVEIFIKPDFRDYYWELYSTPKAHKTAYEFTERYKGVEGNDQLQLDFAVSSSVNGAINDEALDEGWSTVVAIPFASLAKHGDRFKGDGTWTLLIGRYNYLSADYPKEELSAYPQITKVDFHSLPEYAAIKFLDKK